MANQPPYPGSNDPSPNDPAAFEDYSYEHHAAEEPAPSTAAIAGHPLHPLLVLFPVAFLVGAFATDIVYASTLDVMWAQFSMWLTLAGLTMGVLAALTGLVDFVSIRRARAGSAGWIHFFGNAFVLALAGISFGFRWNAPVEFLVPWGILLSAAMTLTLLVTGWYGGELAYRHKIGMIPDRGAKPTEEEARRRRAA